MSDLPPVIESDLENERGLDRMIASAKRRRPTRDGESRLYWRYRRGVRAWERRQRILRVATVWGMALGAVGAAALLVMSRGGTGDSWSQVALAEARVEAEPGPWSLLDLPEVGRFEVDSLVDVAFRDTASERRLTIDKGRLRAEVVPQSSARPVVVVSPQLRVTVVGTEFDVQVENGRTTVALHHGRVRVASRYAEVILESGQSIRSDDPRLAPKAPLLASVVPPPATKVVTTDLPPSPTKVVTTEAVVATVRKAGECTQIADRSQRVACLREASRGEGLSAQNALCLLGEEMKRVAGGAVEALEAFDTYARRFPSGAMIREATLRRVQLLRELGRGSEAMQGLADFERRFGRDPRLEQVSPEPASPRRSADIR